MVKSLISKNAPDPIGNYPHLKSYKDLLFLSGIGPRSALDNSVPGNVYNKSGDLIGYDIVLQTRSVFDNIKSILEDAGSSLDDVIDITVYLTNMKEDFVMFNDIYNSLFDIE